MTSCGIVPPVTGTGNISFFVALVAGKRRVPKPAAGMTALRILGPVSRFNL
jgi:hypothetical protein